MPIFGLHIPVPQIAPFDAQIFNHKVMYQYLTPRPNSPASPACLMTRTPTRSPASIPPGWSA
jgi:hypothetical protein